MVADQADDADIDWEVGDEQWGRVNTPLGTICMVCVPIPLCILHEQEDIDVSAVGEQVELLRLPLIPGYSIDSAVLERAFGAEVTSNVNWSAFDLQQLWWATVTL